MHPFPPVKPTSMLSQRRISQKPFTSGCHVEPLKQTVLPLRANGKRSARQRGRPWPTSSSIHPPNPCTEDDTVQVRIMSFCLSSPSQTGLQFDEQSQTYPSLSPELLSLMFSSFIYFFREQHMDLDEQKENEAYIECLIFLS